MTSRLPRTWLLVVAAFMIPSLLSVAARLAMSPASATAWWQADNSSANLSPDPVTHPQAVVQVMAARVFGWRGALGVHTWIAVKARQANRYTRLEVIGWGVRHGASAVRIHPGTPDGRWYGQTPQVLVDIRGARADTLIAAILEAAPSYPYTDRYRLWPGPNSNTFTAWMGRQVPGLMLVLPPTAIGKDYLGTDKLVASAPSGSGYQFSILGLLGFTVALEEGIELNLLGLTFGIDLGRPAIKVPGLGRIGLTREPSRGSWNSTDPQLG